MLIFTLGRLRICLLAFLACTTLLLVSCTEPYLAETTDSNTTLSTIKSNSHGKWTNMRAVSVAMYGDIWRDIRYHFDLNYEGHENIVQPQINWLLKHPTYLKKALRNSAPYIYYIYQQTKKKDLPAEVAILPILESDYNPFEYSRVGATGLWQMMPGTASGFGLKIDWWYDGRRDVITSTHAALRYLNYLHEYFDNDWLLAIAAYNSGEGKVQAAIHSNRAHNKKTDFWSLHLPGQTRIYVIRMLAIAEIIRNHEDYRINLPQISDSPFLKAVDIGNQIDIKEAAKLANIEESVLRKLNPGLRRFATDPKGPYTLLLPINNADLFNKNLAAVNSNGHKITWRDYRIKPGDSLSTIAHKYHVAPKLLMHVNNIKNPKHIRPNHYLLVPIEKQTQAKHSQTDTKGNKVQYSTKNTNLLNETMQEAVKLVHANHQESNHITEERIPGPKQIVHKVNHGDTLRSIAKRYKVSIPELTFWNHITTHHHLSIGQKLLIWRKNHHGLHRNHHYIKYRVKPGDTLSGIAHRYRTTTHKIVQFNRLKNANHLKLHQLIEVPR